jgi:hypothetical protein
MEAQAQLSFFHAFCFFLLSQPFFISRYTKYKSQKNRFSLSLLYLSIWLSSFVTLA